MVWGKFKLILSSVISSKCSSLFRMVFLMPKWRSCLKALPALTFCRVFTAALTLGLRIWSLLHGGKVWDLLIFNPPKRRSLFISSFVILCLRLNQVGWVGFHFVCLTSLWLCLSFFPAYIASGVELWNKHQEVKKQKALEKQSKEQMPLPIPKSPIPANSTGPAGAGFLCQPHSKFALGGIWNESR